MRESVTFNKVVNIAEDGEITVLQHVFKYPDHFMGATGSRFYPVSKKEYKQRTTKKAIKEFLTDAAGLPDQFSSYNQWAQAIINAGEQEELMFDTSYSELWDYLRIETGLDENKAYIFECSGGGRMFNDKYQGNRNEDLSAIIRLYESKE